MAQFRLLYEVVDPQIDANYEISKNVPVGQVGLRGLRERSVGIFKLSQYRPLSSASVSISVVYADIHFPQISQIDAEKRSAIICVICGKQA